MKILVATDGSKHGASAVDALRGFNFDADSEIKIVTVVDFAMPVAMDIFGGTLPSTFDIEKSAREAAEALIEKTVARVKDQISNTRVDGEVLAGAPASEIVQYAEKFGAELIIVGSHGYSRWERILLGSVSQSVIQHAPCSVMVVRTK